MWHAGTVFHALGDDRDGYSDYRRFAEARGAQPRRGCITAAPDRPALIVLSGSTASRAHLEGSGAHIREE